MQDLLQTIGHSPVMHRGVIFRELLRDCAQPIIGFRGRAERQNGATPPENLPRVGFVLRGGIVLPPCGPTHWCPTGTPRTFRPCFDGGHERSLLHTPPPRVSPSVQLSQSIGDLRFSPLSIPQLRSPPNGFRCLLLFSTRAPTTRKCHPPSAQDVDVVKKGEQCFTSTQTGPYLDRCSMLAQTEEEWHQKIALFSFCALLNLSCFPLRLSTKRWRRTELADEVDQLVPVSDVCHPSHQSSPSNRVVLQRNRWTVLCPLSKLVSACTMSATHSVPAHEDNAC